MTKATNEFRRCLTEVKEVHARQIEQLQRERDAALMAARVHADVEDPNNIHQLPGVDIATTKKVGPASNRMNFLQIIYNCKFSNYISFAFLFFYKFSAPTVIVKQWPSVHCAEERHIVRHFANEKIGIHIKWNVHEVM